MINPILDLHFSSQTGSPYWLDLLRQKGLQRRDIHADNLHLLGAMDVQALRTRPITDFIPQSLHPRMSEMILAETGGTTGDPCRRVYLPEEFHAAFIGPWLQAVARFNFPKGGRWLFVGPSGPHIIGQAARAFARATGSLEPFAIDCDMRWVKQQQPESMGYLLYRDHLLQQSLNIIQHQEITVLFTTPPLLLELALHMTTAQRAAILGIHTGGMGQDYETTRTLATLFPSAVILPGYGNSLFGVCFEQEQQTQQESIFFPADNSLQLRLIPLPQTESEPPRLTGSVAEEERGRLLFHRFDRSFLLINMLERDTAVQCTAGTETGFRDIGSLAYDQPEDGGLY